MVGGSFQRYNGTKYINGCHIQTNKYAIIITKSLYRFFECSMGMFYYYFHTFSERFRLLFHHILP